LKDFFPNMTTDHKAPGFEIATEESKLELVQEDKLSRWPGSKIEGVADMRNTVLAMVGRRLMTTENGYLGTVPKATQQGDIVAILYDCNFPVILRKCGKFY
jgi:hypothetical protein